MTEKTEYTRAVLECALDTLNERGWCQGTMLDSEGRVCALGALSVAITKTWQLYETDLRIASSSALSVAEDVFEVDHPNDKIARWNDAPSTTVEDVKLLIKRAIEACDND